MKKSSPATQCSLVNMMATEAGRVRKGGIEKGKKGDTMMEGRKGRREGGRAGGREGGLHY